MTAPASDAHGDDEQSSPTRPRTGDSPDPEALGDDPAVTDHPTGQAQAAENAENEPVS